MLVRLAWLKDWELLHLYGNVYGILYIHVIEIVKTKNIKRPVILYLKSKVGVRV